jgi:hypothetical protein
VIQGENAMRMNFDSKKQLPRACIAALGVIALAASAQDAAPAGQDAQSMEEVVVSGFRSSLEKSLEAKRNSTNFTDSISAEDVGKLPDNNLAEAIARIPGVQISRTNGEVSRSTCAVSARASRASRSMACPSRSRPKAASTRGRVIASSISTCCPPTCFPRWKSRSRRRRVSSRAASRAL